MPAIDPKFHNGVDSFTNFSYPWSYWSSTTREAQTAGMWLVLFGDGAIDLGDKADGFFFVRAVRGP